MLGEKVYATSFSGNEKTVNCSLTEGIYFVQIREEERLWTEKIVVQ
jgi:hypothetical protein